MRGNADNPGRHYRPKGRLTPGDDVDVSVSERGVFEELEELAGTPEFRRAWDRVRTAAIRGAAAGVLIKGGLHALTFVMYMLSRLRGKGRKRVTTLADALHDTVLHTCFLAALGSSYTAVDEGIAFLFGKASTQRWRALVAGLVAGQSLRITGATQRHYSLATYILLRGLTLLVRTGNKPSAPPALRALLRPTRTSHGDTLLMCAAASQILYSFIMAPSSLPPAYVRFINRMGGKDPAVWAAMREHAMRNAAGLSPGPLRSLVHTPLAYLNARPGRLHRTPCEIFHPGQSCMGHAATTLPQAYSASLSVYVPFYLVSSVLVHRTALLAKPGELLPKMALAVLRSSAFLSSYIATAFAGACTGFWLTGTNTGSVIAGSVWAGGLATLLEKKSRRMELAMYCAARALEAFIRCCWLWSQAGSGTSSSGSGIPGRPGGARPGTSRPQPTRGPLPWPPHPPATGGTASTSSRMGGGSGGSGGLMSYRLDVLLFSLGCGAIMHCYSDCCGEHRDVFRSKYLNVLDFIFGNQGVQQGSITHVPTNLQLVSSVSRRLRSMSRGVLSSTTPSSTVGALNSANSGEYSPLALSYSQLPNTTGGGSSSSMGPSRHQTGHGYSGNAGNGGGFGGGNGGGFGGGNGGGNGGGFGGSFQYPSQSLAEGRGDAAGGGGAGGLPPASSSSGGVVLGKVHHGHEGYQRYVRQQQQQQQEQEQQQSVSSSSGLTPLSHSQAGLSSLAPTSWATGGTGAGGGGAAGGVAGGGGGVAAATTFAGTSAFAALATDTAVAATGPTAGLPEIEAQQPPVAGREEAPAQGAGVSPETVGILEAAVRAIEEAGLEVPVAGLSLAAPGGVGGAAVGGAPSGGPGGSSSSGEWEDVWAAATAAASAPGVVSASSAAAVDPAADPPTCTTDADGGSSGGGGALSWAARLVAGALGTSRSASGNASSDKLTGDGGAGTEQEAAGGIGINGGGDCESVRGGRSKRSPSGAFFFPAASGRSSGWGGHNSLRALGSGSGGDAMSSSAGAAGGGGGGGGLSGTTGTMRRTMTAPHGLAYASPEVLMLLSDPASELRGHGRCSYSLLQRLSSGGDLPPDIAAAAAAIAAAASGGGGSGLAAASSASSSTSSLLAAAMAEASSPQPVRTTSGTSLRVRQVPMIGSPTRATPFLTSRLAATAAAPLAPSPIAAAAGSTGAGGATPIAAAAGGAAATGVMPPASGSSGGSAEFFVDRISAASFTGRRSRDGSSGSGGATAASTPSTAGGGNSLASAAASAESAAAAAVTFMTHGAWDHPSPVSGATASWPRVSLDAPEVEAAAYRAGCGLGSMVVPLWARDEYVSSSAPDPRVSGRLGSETLATTLEEDEEEEAEESETEREEEEEEQGEQEGFVGGGVGEMEEEAEEGGDK